jgi:hypothetical protein
VTYPFPAHQPPMFPQQPPRAPADTMAVISLILGIFPIVPILGSVAAIILGVMSRNDAKRAGLQPSAVSAWGIGLGIVAIIGTLILIVVLTIAAATPATA